MVTDTRQRGTTLTWKSSWSCVKLSVVALSSASLDNSCKSWQYSVSFLVDLTPPAIQSKQNGAQIRVNFPLGTQTKSLQRAVSSTRCEQPGSGGNHVHSILTFSSRVWMRCSQSLTISFSFWSIRFLKKPSSDARTILRGNEHLSRSQEVV